jgi:hypothetical protein
MESDREIGQAYAAHGARRALLEAERAPMPDDRLNLWRTRLLPHMRPDEYVRVVSSGIAVRDQFAAQFARIDANKAEAKRRAEEARRAEFDPRIVALPVVRRPRLSLAR